jgi:RNA polymerase sigma-70 factor (ECF subfamily)
VSDFDEVFSQYFRIVYNYALALCRNVSVAEDITAETFLKAYKAIDGFKGECELRVWLCQIAKNTYFSLLKKNKRETSLEDIELESDCPDLLLDITTKETFREIHRRLHSLAEPYKAVFSLRVFGELSFAEIAELFGKTENWARVTYHRAKLKLQEGLL